MKIMRFLLIFLAAAFFSPLTAQAQLVQPAPSWGGMVTFTFDDANKNIYENALPFFKKYQVVGTISPIVRAIENQEDWIVTWPQLKAFAKAGWEIGSHTMTHPHLPALTDAELDYELGQSKKILANHGIDAKTLVFPYTEADARVLNYTTRYYENSRMGVGELNGIDCDRYAILCKELSNTTQPEEVIGWIDEAVQSKLWLVLMIHEVVPGTPSAFQYNVADLEKVVAYVAANRIPTPTINQALKLRQAALGPNLVKNPKLERGDDGWARRWSRNDVTQVTVEAAPVNRPFSYKQRLKIAGSSHQNMANPEMIKLPDKNSAYLFSFFAEVATDGTSGGGAGFCVDEFDANGNWVGFQWLGGIYYHNCGMPAYIYQPSSPLVDQIMIDIFTDKGADITFWGDNFYFGSINDSFHGKAKLVNKVFNKK